MAPGRALLVAIFAALGSAGAANAQSASAEDAVKATFLYRFASFVTWPESAFATPDSPVQVCILGSEAFKTAAQNAVQNQSIGARRLDVRSIASPSEGRACHVLYAQGAATDEALHDALGAPVLTVTDSASRRGGRGVIHFAVVDNRVKFHIDDALAAENHLTISSRLLALALSVRKRSGS